MSDGDRLDIVKAGRLIFGAAFAAVILSLVWQIGSDYGFERGREQQNTSEYAANAERSIRVECANLSGTMEARCIREIEKSYEQAEQAARDLSAQEQMADWAFWMMFVSAVMAGLTLWALYYIRENLRAALELAEDSGEATSAMQEANKIARRFGQRQIRAYIHVESARLQEDIDSCDDDPKDRLILVFKNSGQSPGHITGRWIKMVWIEASDAARDTIIDIDESDLSTIIPGGKTAAMTFPFSDSLFYLSDKCKGYMALVGTVTYRDVFDLPHSTQFAFLSGDEFISDDRGGYVLHPNAHYNKMT